MAYATLDDLMAHGRGGRTDDLAEGAWPAGISDEGVLLQSLDDASALIDSYLCQRVTLPLSEVPPVLRRTCLVIAYADLHIEIVPDKVKEDRDRAIKWLEQIASGKLDLPITAPSPSAVATPSSGDVRFVPSSRRFGDLSGF